MSSVNKVIIMGRLGADPELRYTKSGQATCTLRVATSEMWGTGEQRQERTEWHNIVLWARQAELAKEYLAKGRLVYVEGRLQTRKWQDRDGNDRYTTEIVAREIQFIDSRRNDGPAASPSPRPAQGGAPQGGSGGRYDAPAEEPFLPENDDDIPF